jgi:hypothetical protein
MNILLSLARHEAASLCGDKSLRGDGGINAALAKIFRSAGVTVQRISRRLGLRSVGGANDAPAAVAAWSDIGASWCPGFKTPALDSQPTSSAHKFVAARRSVVTSPAHHGALSVIVPDQK